MVASVFALAGTGAGVMPLTAAGRKTRAAMREFYGPEKGDRVFFAYENKQRKLGSLAIAKPRKKKRRKKNRS
jgi:hypothetical protein